MNSATANKLSVTFCITELDVGGAEKALVRIAVGLQQSGWKVRVISLRDEGVMARVLQSEQIPVTALNCGGLADVRAWYRLRRELKAHPTDVLMCFLHQANIYGRLAARFSGGPVVVSGVRVADRRKVIVLTDRLTSCCTAHYVAVSQHVADTHAQLCGIPADKIDAIPNGVDAPVAQERSGTPGSSENVLLSVGRLIEQKDPLCLLDAFSRLPNELRNKTSLAYAGEGPLQEPLRAAIKKQGLQDRVELLGHTDDVSELMQRATLLVLPSRWEGMPNVVLEAMANGLPVVASNVDGVKEVITPENTGWLVPPRDPAALAAALEKALNNRDLRNRFSKSAQALVAESFTWKSVIKQYDELLRSLVAKT